MFGWEFPPAKTGGLGTHCYELVKNLGSRGVSVLLFVPERSQNVRKDLENVEIAEVGFNLSNPYSRPDSATSEKSYGRNFFHEVEAFNKESVAAALNEDFDIIHCHDWMTIPAGIELKMETGNPLIFTVHSTEYDRTINIHPCTNIINIEKRGIDEADRIVTVSRNMKGQLLERYNAIESKISVIYNGIDSSSFPGITEKGNQKIVLFLGRLTNQKGPSFFLQTAEEVLRKEPDVLFVVSGQGERLPELIREAIDLTIMDHVLFTGYLREEELVRAYEMADVYVMPSVAEPFGISALEAIASGTPSIVSKNAGVAERIQNCFKVDYWDTLEMANKIVSVLRYDVLRDCMRRNAFEELRDLSWSGVAEETIEVYGRTL